MSDTGPEKLKSEWDGIAFDSATLLGAVGDKLRKVRNAAGDVQAAKLRAEDDIRAAQARFREDVADAKAPVGEATGALTGSQQEIVDDLISKGLVGRAIGFRSGSSLPEVHPSHGPEDQREAVYDLHGVEGTITGFEVGTLRGNPLESPDTVVLHVDTTLSVNTPADRVAVDAAATDYVTSERPE